MGFCVGKRMRVAALNADREFQCRDLWGVFSNVEAAKHLFPQGRVQGSRSFWLHGSPSTSGRGTRCFAGRREGRMEPFVSVQQVLPLTANDSNAQIKTFRRRLAWLKLVLCLPQPVLLLLGGLSHDPGLRTC